MWEKRKIHCKATTEMCICVPVGSWAAGRAGLQREDLPALAQLQVAGEMASKERLCQLFGELSYSL